LKLRDKDRAHPRPVRLIPDLLSRELLDLSDHHLLLGLFHQVLGSLQHVLGFAAFATAFTSATTSANIIIVKAKDFKIIVETNQRKVKLIP
jgi:hypothetical protein